MRLIVYIVFALFAGLSLQSAQSDETTPFLYARDHLTVMRAHLPPPGPPALPWLPAMVEEPGVPFDVEVRDAMTLYHQKGWFSLSSPSDMNGVLMVFAAPGIPPIIHSAQYAPLDILLLDKEGRIVQIVPNIKLSELQEDILPATPVLAFLFLKGGTCEKLSINPGDRVEYPLFKQPPKVLSAPPAADPQAR